MLYLHLAENAAIRDLSAVVKTSTTVVCTRVPDFQGKELDFQICTARYLIPRHLVLNIGNRQKLSQSSFVLLIWRVPTANWKSGRALPGYTGEFPNGLRPWYTGNSLPNLVEKVVLAGLKVRGATGPGNGRIIMTPTKHVVCNVHCSFGNLYWASNCATKKRPYISYPRYYY
eukprot:2250027-Rhodomonas_salina.2